GPGVAVPVLVPGVGAVARRGRGVVHQVGAVGAEGRAATAGAVVDLHRRLLGGAVVLPGDVVALDVRQDLVGPAAVVGHRLRGLGGVARRPVAAAPGDGAAQREALVVGVDVAVDGHADLVQVVAAAGPRRRGAHLLDGGQQEADEDGDDGDDHQQL